MAFYKKFYLNRLYWIGGAIGLFLLILSLPLLLSSQWGKEMLVARLNHHLQSQVEVEKVELSWFSGQSAYGVVVENGAATIESIHSDISLLRLLFSSKSLGNTDIHGLKAHLKETQPSLISATSSETTDFHIRIPFTGNVSIKNGFINLCGAENVSFSDVDASMEHDPHKGCASVKMRGLSQQGKMSGEFAIEAIAQGLQEGGLALKLSPTGIPIPAEKEGLICVNLDIENASVDIFDQLLAIHNPLFAGMLSNALGHLVNLKLNTVITQKGPSIELQGKSQHMHADLAAEVREGKLILQRRGNLSLRITPELFSLLGHIFSKDPAFSLKDSVELALDFERMSMPTTSSTSLPTARLRVSVENITLLSKQLDEIEINDITASIERLEASGAVVIEAGATLLEQEQEGSIKFSGKLLDEKSFGFSDATLSAKQISTLFVDRLLKAEGAFTHLLGPSFDTQIKFYFDQRMTAEVQAGSDHFAAPSLVFAIDNGFTLTKPAQVQVQLTPSAARFFSRSTVDLEQKADLLLTISALSKAANRDLLVDMKIASSPFTLLTSCGKLACSNVKGQIEKSEKISYNLQADMVSQTDHLTALIGQESLLSLQGEERKSLSSIKTSLQSERLDFRSNIQIDPEGVVTLLSPATARYFASSQEGNFAQKTPLEVSIEKLRLDLKEGLLSHSSQGKSMLGRLDILDREGLQATLRGMELQWHYEGEKNRATAQLSALTEQSGQEGDIQAKIYYSGLKRVEAAINIKKMPVALLTASTGDLEWRALLGDSLDLTSYVNTETGAATLSLHAEDIAATLPLALNREERILYNAKPIEISFHFTEDRAAAAESLFNHYAIPFSPLIEELISSKIDLTLSKLSLPLQRRAEGLPQPLFYSTLLDGKIKSSGSHSLTIDFLSPTLSQGINFTAHYEKDLAHLQMSGQLCNLRLPIEQVELQADLQATDLSIAHLPLLPKNIGSSLDSIVGQRASGTAKISLQGHNGEFFVDLKGEEGSLKLNSQLNNRVLTLIDPLLVKLNSPKLRMLQEIAPYAASAISSKEPIEFLVEPKGFSLPLTTTDYRLIQIPHASLHLGKMELDAESPWGTILTLLASDRDKSPIEVWFTPLQLSLQEGIVRLSRMDALINNRYPVALWGKVDLIKDRVRMTMALSAAALKEAYDLNLPNYMLQIPFTGSIRHPTIDTAKATTRITALVAQSHGSDEGALIGGILDLLGGSGESIPPPPQDIPWKKEPYSPVEKSREKSRTKGFLDLFK